MAQQYRIRWAAHLRANDEKAAQRIASRMAEALGRPLDIERIERYWKLPELQVLTAWTEVEATEFAPAIVEALRLGGRLAYGMTVDAPWDEVGDGVLSGWASLPQQRFRVAGIESLDLTLGTEPDGDTLGPNQKS